MYVDGVADVDSYTICTCISYFRFYCFPYYIMLFEFLILLSHKHLIYDN